MILIFNQIQVFKIDTMDYILAQSRYRRRKYVEATSVCDTLLTKNPKDEHAQMLKCLCLIKQNEFDELEFQEQGAAEELMNQTIDKTKRIATSLKTGHNPIMHPTSQAGRIVSGYQRPGTRSQGSRAGKAQNILSRAGGAGNLMTSNGRVLRLATASLIASGENMLNIDVLSLKNIAKKKSMSRIIFKYLFYVDKDLKKALELAAYATQMADFKDQWWKVAVGKCYYHMGLNLEAKKQFQSSIKHNNNIESYLYLSKLSLKQKQHDEAISILEQAKRRYPCEIVLNIHIARIYQSLNEIQKSFEGFKSVLEFQNCNVQAVASIAAYYYYKDQAEVAAKLYQRLIELGFGTAQVWNNIGLCCFQSGKYELFYSCFQRALNTTSDEFTLSDIWFNLGNLYINLGNIASAEMCFKTSLVHNQNNPQSLNNMAVINFKNKNIDGAIMFAERSYKASPQFDAAFNLSIWYFSRKDLKSAKYFNSEALKIYPDHYDSLKLEKKIQLMLN